MVRKLRAVTLGERKRAREVEEFAHGWCEWDKLPTSSSAGYELTTETLGMARREEPCDETWDSGNMASLDIKTAFDEAKPKHVVRILDDHNTHGWLIGRPFRERCRYYQGRAPSKVWKVDSTSTGAYGKEAWKPSVYGRELRDRSWSVWRKNG